MIFFLLLAILFVVVEVYCDGDETKLDFYPPFRSFNSFDGSRHIPFWRTGGDATIYDGFIRLTPDSKSKSGYLASDQSIRSKQFSISLKFRVSGKGRNYFGDGFALLLAKSPVYSIGNFFGTQGAFDGVAVVFDTFRNNERESVHKDVGLMFNNGEKNVANEIFEYPGCDSSFRYNELRSDFNTNKFSELRISVDLINNEIKITIDSQGKGSFKECTTAKIPENHLKFEDIFLTLSSTTGDLSDNHDILSLSVYDNLIDTSLIPNDSSKILEIKNRKIEDELNEYLSKFGISNSSLSDAEKSLVINQRDEIVEIEIKLSELEHHLEHQLTDLQKEVKEMISSLNDDGSKSLDKMEYIEKLVNDLINEKMVNEFQLRLKNVEESLKHAIIHEVGNKSSHWKIPYVTLVILFIIIVFIVYRKYKNFMKSVLI